VLYTLLLGGMVHTEKRRLRRMWTIPDEYDDYWHFRRFWRTDVPRLTRLQYLDFHTYLPDDILTKVDRTSMAVSLEVRVPLLATDVVEFSFSLPEPVRFAGGVSKGLLKQAYRDRLPAGIADRPKKGFSVPFAAWRPIFGPHSRSIQENILYRQFADQLARLGASRGAGRPVAVAASL
jgi:asparagine synthase (glutamine-hydrolysing)